MFEQATPSALEATTSTLLEASTSSFASPSAILDNINEPPSLLVFYALFLWTLGWKSVSLWRAARRNHKLWFGIIMITSTLGVLEIAYYFYLSRYDWNHWEDTIAAKWKELRHKWFSARD